MKRTCAMAIVVTLSVAAAQATSNTSLTLTDLNSFATVDTRAGMTGWTVDGVNQLKQQSFWFRVGAAGGEAALGSLVLGTVATTDTNGNGLADTLYLPYLGGGFKVEVTYTLRGGTTGSGTSDIGEAITVTNTGGTSLDFHFFQYCNLSLNGQAVNSSVLIENGRTAIQTNGAAGTSETVIAPRPSRYEAGFAPNILASLMDGSPTTLSNSSGPVGPGDLAWAFQWDRALAPGGSFLISKDKYLAAPVPEPLTMASAILAIGGLGSYLRKRTRVA